MKIIRYDIFRKILKMKIFLLISLSILAIFLLGRQAFYSAKRNLFRDLESWSGKDINIKHNKALENINLNKNENYLKIIADESKIYLEEQELRDEE